MTKSLDKMLADFSPTEMDTREKLSTGGQITILLLPSYKERYSAIQRKSKGRFHKKLRELIQAAIDQVEQGA